MGQHIENTNVLQAYLTTPSSEVISLQALQVRAIVDYIKKV